MDEAEEIRKKFDGFSYRDLQKEAKKLNIKANGKKERLLERIVKKLLGEDLDSTQTTAAGPADMSSVNSAKEVSFQEYQEDTSVDAEQPTPENEKLIDEDLNSTQATTADKEKDANMQLVDRAKEMSSEEKEEEMKAEESALESKKLLGEDLDSTQATTADKEEDANMPLVDPTKEMSSGEKEGVASVGAEQSTPENEKLVDEDLDSTQATTADKEEEVKAEESAHESEKLLDEDLDSTQATTADKEEDANMPLVDPTKEMSSGEKEGVASVGAEQSTPENEKLVDEDLDSTQATTADKEEEVKAEESAHESEKLLGEDLGSTQASTADKEEDANMSLIDPAKEMPYEEKEEDAKISAEEFAPENGKLLGEDLDSTQASFKEDVDMSSGGPAKELSFQEYQEDTSVGAEEFAPENVKLIGEDLDSTQATTTVKEEVVDMSSVDPPKPVPFQEDTSVGADRSARKHAGVKRHFSDLENETDQTVSPKKSKLMSPTKSPGTFRRHFNTLHQHGFKNMPDIEADQKRKEERHKELTKSWTPQINRLAQPKLRNTPSPKKVLPSPFRAVSASPFKRVPASSNRALSETPFDNVSSSYLEDVVMKN